MRRTTWIGLVAAAALVGLAAPVWAEVVVQTPWVSVRVGRTAPPPPATFPYDPAPPAVAPVDPPPVPGVPVLPAPTPVSARPPTVGEFVDSFHPTGGAYEAVLLHPLTGCPVKVCFTLPPGCPCKVHVHPRRVRFEYAHCDVVIHFYRDGSYKVAY
jgi:hypothetical protein